MPGHDIIVIGASAGGVEALATLVHEIPSDLRGAIFIVLHIPAETTSSLPHILSRAGSLPASHPANGAPIEYGHIYVAPPDYHLLIEQEHVCLVRGPKENRHRPAIDPLFRSAAEAYGQRVVGVVLTGALNDGTAGLLAIQRNGGIAVIQDPAEALYSSMPQSALEHVKIDYRLPLAAIGPLLGKLTQEQVTEEAQVVPPNLAKEIRIVTMNTSPFNENELVGKPSSFSCPECGGVLWEIPDETFLRFRCRVGHALSAENVLLEQGEQAERALWSALKALEEKVSLSRRLAKKAREDGRYYSAQNFENKIQQIEKDALVLRQLLLQPAFEHSMRESQVIEESKM
jgi:two-component system, chemotaxis family, protein-glutamate methylesterase/glutaminase